MRLWIGFIGLFIVLFLFFVLLEPNDARSKTPSKIGTWQENTVISVITPETPIALPPKSLPGYATNDNCSRELTKYPWNQVIASRVMFAESGGNTNVVNHNLATGDHSVGCFQVNILNELAKSRPSESELKKPQVNVAFAYNLWKVKGWQPWGVCRKKVRCF